MFNFGQIFGWNNTLCVQLRRILSYDINEHVFKFYSNLIQILKLDVFKFGKFSISLVDNLICIKWNTQNEILLSYFNFNEFNQKGKVVIDDKNENCEIKELFENQLINPYLDENKNNCVDFSLENYQMKVYFISQNK